MYLIKKSYLSRVILKANPQIPKAKEFVFLDVLTGFRCLRKVVKESVWILELWLKKVDRTRLGHGMLVNEATDVEFVVFGSGLYQRRQLIIKICFEQV